MACFELHFMVIYLWFSRDLIWFFMMICWDFFGWFDRILWWKSRFQPQKWRPNKGLTTVYAWVYGGDLIKGSRIDRKQATEPGTLGPSVVLCRHPAWSNLPRKMGMWRFPGIKWLKNSGCGISRVHPQTKGEPTSQVVWTSSQPHGYMNSTRKNTMYTWSMYSVYVSPTVIAYMSL